MNLNCNERTHTSSERLFWLWYMNNAPPLVFLKFNLVFCDISGLRWFQLWSMRFIALAQKASKKQSWSLSVWKGFCLCKPDAHVTQTASTNCMSGTAQICNGIWHTFSKRHSESMNLLYIGAQLSAPKSSSWLTGNDECKLCSILIENVNNVLTTPVGH